MGNLHEVSCGKRFANIPHPSCRAKKTQLQAPTFSEKISSILLHRFWAVSIDSGRCLLKLPTERGRIAANSGDFSSPIGAGNSVDFLRGHGAVPRPTKVRCLEERAAAQKCQQCLEPEWRETFLQNLRGARYGVGSGRSRLEHNHTPAT